MSGCRMKRLDQGHCTLVSDSLRMVTSLVMRDNKVRVKHVFHSYPQPSYCLSLSLT